jgi:GNAT superfamily N-acetyltransferase
MTPPNASDHACDLGAQSLAEATSTAMAAGLAGLSSLPSSVAPVAQARVGRIEFFLGSFSPADLNPFDLPSVQRIWNPREAALAKEAYDEERVDISNHPEADFGQAFLLVAREELAAPRVVGVSGYFSVSEDFSRFYLRWHGVEEALRGQGLSRWMCDEVKRAIQERHPNAVSLVEHVPEAPEFAASAESFRRLGFKPLEELHHYDWSPLAWREMELDIRAPRPRAKP